MPPAAILSSVAVTMFKWSERPWRFQQPQEDLQVHRMREFRRTAETAMVMVETSLKRDAGLVDEDVAISSPSVGRERGELREM